MKEVIDGVSLEVTVTDRTKTTVESQKQKRGSIKRIVKNVTVCEFIGSINGVETIKEEVETWKESIIYRKKQEILERLKNIHNEKTN